MFFRWAGILVGAFLTFLAAAAFLSALGGGVRKAPPDDILVVADSLNTIRSLDPGVVYVGEAISIFNNVYEKLFYLDPQTGEVVKGVVSNYSFSSDGAEVELEIAPDRFFHSGAAVTAEDVHFSLIRVLTLGGPLARFLGQIGITQNNAEDAIRHTGKNTIALSVSSGLARSLVLNALASPATYVVDRDLVLSHESNGDLGQGWLASHSAGSGPFLMKEWRHGEYVILERNENHSNPPLMKRVIVRDISEPSIMRMLIGEGEIDIALRLDADQLAAVKKLPGVDMLSKPVARVIYMAMSQRNEHLKDRRVRQAINYLIDRETISQTLLQGTYAPHQGFWPKGLWASYDEPYYEFNPEKAKALLKEAGYHDGLEIVIDCSNLPPYPAIAQAMQASAAEAGVDVKILMTDDAQNLTKMVNRGFDGLLMRSFSVSFADPADGAGWLVSNPDNSEEASTRNAPWRAGYQDTALNEMAAQAARNQDMESRRSTYIEMQKKLQEDGAVVVLFQQIKNIAQRDGVTGLTQGALNYDTFYANVAKGGVKADEGDAP